MPKKILIIEKHHNRKTSTKDSPPFHLFQGLKGKAVFSGDACAEIEHNKNTWDAT